MTQPLIPGQTAPWFHAQALSGISRYAFDSAAGRPILMLLIGSAASPAAQAALRLIETHRGLFNDRDASFFGVSTDPADVEHGRIAQSLPGIRWFLDHDLAISTLYGASAEGAYRAHWLLLDPMLRVIRGAPIADGEAVIRDLSDRLAAPATLPTAPVLVVPEVLSRDLCSHLIALYDRDGGTESGFMREENGITVQKLDRAHKSRADYVIDDNKLIATLKARIAVALRPMILRAFQYDATRVERWIVACYTAENGGHFRPHRDNTTKGTAHRKFACTINLNAEDYDGGDLCFPEFGKRTYRAPTGGAVIFSCSLLHEVKTLTRGRRYAFLPFLYDDAAAQLREENQRFLTPELATYRFTRARGIPQPTAA